MSNPGVTLNLPPIVDTGGIHQKIANGDINKECSLSISTVSTISLEIDEDKISCSENDNKSTINVVNSNDVIIGSVTQFHGPVTIVQQPQSPDSKPASDEKKLKAKLVTTDYVPSPTTKDLPTCMSKRFYVPFAALTVILSIIALTVIFSVDKKDYTTRDNEGTTEDCSTTDVSDKTSHDSVPTTTLPALSSTTVDPTRDYTNYLGGHEFFSVSAWRGRSALWETPITPPIEFIIVSHTAGVNCQNFNECANQLRTIQAMHVTNGQPQIYYNFLIGGDGNVYEARGWHARNVHRDSTIGISFMGNFVVDEPTDWMIDAFDKLIALGIILEVLPTKIQIVAHNHTTPTQSPGQNIYRVIKNYPNFYSGILPQPRFNP